MRVSAHPCLIELSPGQDSDRWHWKSQCMETCMAGHRPHLQQGSFTSESEENCVGPCLVPTSEHSSNSKRHGSFGLKARAVNQNSLLRDAASTPSTPRHSLPLLPLTQKHVLLPSICVRCRAWLGGHAAIEHGLSSQTVEAKLSKHGMHPDLSTAVRRRADGGTAPGRLAHKASSADEGRPIPHLS